MVHTAAGIRATGAAILVVDDEQALVSIMQKILERAGHRVEVATTPAEALAPCADGKVALDLMLIDSVMPGMSGSEFAEAARQVRPGLKVMLMSGYGDTVKLLDRLAGSSVLLQKPFGPEELIRLVTSACASAR